jgi:hypothetical protein
MPRAKKLNLLDSLSQRKIEYTPILFDNGETQYSSDDVRLCVEDYYRSAEQSIKQNRRVANEVYKNDINPKYKKNIKEDIPHTPEQIRVDEIKKSGDYYFIIQVAKARNELDLMRDLRIKMHTIDEDTGFSKIDLMQNKICDLVSKQSLTYQDMAEIRFTINTLKSINEQASTNVNIGQLNMALNQSAQQAEKVAETVREPTIQDVREKALKGIIDVPYEDKE